MGTNNSNDMAKAANIIDSFNGENKNVKRVKKDRGLIERTEGKDEKIILVEDNRQVLFG